ncbi:wall-associated receptor kinase-like 1 [Cannabis sativa]|uniref:wall-associated receptor kinase-like 1 n=1 Tax=Cannabis sativa TaxID=3483 RepID=UPI0029C9F342|nr:wall-associated receptor kinase-like 1 [Cannabis sativa]
MVVCMVKYYYYLFVVINGLSSIVSSLSSPSSSSFARDGCEEKCGDVTIPYPFGMGSSSKCYIDKSFQISCENGITPFLNISSTSRLQVLNFSLFDDDGDQGQWVRVTSPISFFDNCSNKETNANPPNLSGTPFYYSSGNKFVAVSCGVLAKLETNTGDNTFFGCTSSSNGSTCTNSLSSSSSNIDIKMINCSNNEVDCCTTLFSSNSATTTINISMDNNNDLSMAAGTCKYAFLVDNNYTGKYYNDNNNIVPVRISWRLNHSLFDIFKQDIMPTKSSNTFYCKDSTSDLPFICHCNKGYRGNPYIVDGCKDIDECKETPKRCSPPKGRCVNTVGGFICKDSNKLGRTKAKFFFIGIGSGLGAIAQVFGAWRLMRHVRKIQDIKGKSRFFKRNGGLSWEDQINSTDNNNLSLVEDYDEEQQNNSSEDNIVDPNNLEEGNEEKNSSDVDNKLFELEELEKATNRFSVRIFGQGNQGSVYKGMLEDGRIVGVKKFILIDEAKVAEFINEVVILSRINHRNIVKLFGCCLENDVPLLVYEFISNGTLSEYIHERKAGFSFSWNMRLQIAIDVATALSYLHAIPSFKNFHWDVNSTNILLHENLRAKLATFGTTRTISLDIKNHLHDTSVYLDPEYFESRQFTDKSDVYSFGVVLAELLTGRKAISTKGQLEDEERILAVYFVKMMKIKNENSVFEIIESEVVKTAQKRDILSVAELARKCLRASGNDRPTMREVKNELQKLGGIGDGGGQQINNEEEELVADDQILENNNASSSAAGGFFDSITSTTTSF